MINLLISDWGVNNRREPEEKKKILYALSYLFNKMLVVWTIILKT